MITEVQFLTDLVVRRHKEKLDDKLFFTDATYRIRYKEDGEWVPYKIPTQFGSDFSSVPGIFRPLISKLDSIEGSVIHDHACRHKTMPRKKADELFLACNKAAGMGWAKRNLMYGAVSIYTFWKGIWE